MTPPYVDINNYAHRLIVNVICDYMYVNCKVPSSFMQYLCSYAYSSDMTLKYNK